MTTTSSNYPRYTTGVSFDTFETSVDAAAMFSFTLQAKSEGFQRARGTRAFLVAASRDESGSHALEWALESLVQDGDELIVLRGFDPDDAIKEESHDDIREEAKELLKHILDRNSEFEGRNLSVVVEFVAGPITNTIERMIALYRPDSLVVGFRGKTGALRAFGAALGAPGMGSVSRYCVSHSPVPVIVVRPERNVRKTVEKRAADPKRRTNQFDELVRFKTTDSRR